MGPLSREVQAIEFLGRVKIPSPQFLKEFFCRKAVQGMGKDLVIRLLAFGYIETQTSPNHPIHEVR